MARLVVRNPTCRIECLDAVSGSSQEKWWSVVGRRLVLVVVVVVVVVGFVSKVKNLEISSEALVRVRRFHIPPGFGSVVVVVVVFVCLEMV